MRKYTFVFKKKVVSDYLNNEGGYKYLAHKYQINRTLVRHWVRIYTVLNNNITLTFSFYNSSFSL
ncbi:hypothetical protein EfmAA242_20430 [Enterococcus faecium]|nr:hypothetical protein EfmAA242_20430 [Enterococcus faecium]